MTEAALPRAFKFPAPDCQLSMIDSNTTVCWCPYRTRLVLCRKVLARGDKPLLVLVCSCCTAQLDRTNFEARQFEPNFLVDKFLLCFRCKLQPFSESPAARSCPCESCDIVAAAATAAKYKTRTIKSIDRCVACVCDESGTGRKLLRNNSQAFSSSTTVR